MNNILCIDDGLVHPPLAARWELRKTIRKLPGVKIQHARSLEILTRASLNEFGALVIYLHHNTLSDEALDAFDHFIGHGGGVLAVHSATASYKQSSHYFEILGGRFTGHGPVSAFTVAPCGDSELFKGLPAFSVRDELYKHELEPGIQSHFQSELDGEIIPVVWTSQYGAGRVCYACPGHSAASLRNPVYKQVLLRGLDWVLG